MPRTRAEHRLDDAAPLDATPSHRLRWAAHGAAARAHTRHWVTAVLPGLAPGLLLAAAATAASILLGEYVPGVSPLLIAIVLGALLANAVALPESLAPGITFSAKRLLRVGVALLGLQLVVGDILGLGWGVVGLIVAVVALGTCGGMWLGRLLGIPWTQRLLISCGSSFCGASAIAAVDGVLAAGGARDGEDDQEATVTGIALATVFGSLMIAIVPLVSAGLGLTDEQAGIWAGASIHEVGQVVAVGGIVGGGALAVAMLVKLGRVLMLAPVLVAIGAARRRREAAPTAMSLREGAAEQAAGAPGVGDAAGATSVDGAAGATSAAGARRPPVVPLFVVGFVVLVAVRSTGLLPDGVVSAGGAVQTALLTAAMFALGTGVRLAALKKVGPRPLVLAAALTMWVGGIGLAGAVLLG